MGFLPETPPPGQKMDGKRNQRRYPPLLLFLVALGLFVAACNFLTLGVHSRWREAVTKYLLGKHQAPRFTVPARPKRPARSGRAFHVVMTATDTPYSQWQSRIMYYWYKRVRDGEGSEMGEFTRLLHSGWPDSLMDEIPTFVVDPLPAGMDLGYVVLNRPWAFIQWLERAKIDEEYILMAEPDHIFVRPLPNLAHGDEPAAYPFFYIRPSKSEKILRKFYPKEKGPASSIDPIGNSPVIIKKLLLVKIAPTWFNVSIQMKKDPVASKAFGWVLEMYGYAVASALHGLRHSLHEDFMVQPPLDVTVGNAFMIHYCYGCHYSSKGERIQEDLGDWNFNKRLFRRFPLPRNLSLPPPGVPESVATLVTLVNEATANIPGWDYL